MLFSGILEYKSMKRSLLFLSLCLGFIAFSPAVWAGEDCEQDPVYSRSMAGITTLGARIRHRPCMTGSEILTVAPQGAKLEILAETDGWYKVRYAGITGWMGSQLVKASLQNNAAAEKVLLEKKAVTQPAITEKDWIKKNITGISEKDFEKLEDGYVDLFKRLKGKWIMRVQARGQVYMVEGDGSIRLVPNWKTFAQTQIKKTETITESKEESKSASSNQNGSISLKTKQDGGKIWLEWSLSGMESKQGFKVIVSEQMNPVYPGNTAHYLSDMHARSDKWTDLKAGKTYYFRVCEYLGGACGIYSNNASITVIGDLSTSVKPSYQKIDSELQLQAVSTGNGVQLSWSACTASGFQGYKVVRSRDNSDPYYPASGYLIYKTDRSDTSFLDTSAESGIYYYRICSLESDGPVTCGNVVKVTR